MEYELHKKIQGNQDLNKELDSYMNLNTELAQDNEEKNLQIQTLNDEVYELKV